MYITVNFCLLLRWFDCYAMSDIFSCGFALRASVLCLGCFTIACFGGVGVWFVCCPLVGFFWCLFPVPWAFCFCVWVGHRLHVFVIVHECVDGCAYCFVGLITVVMSALLGLWSCIEYL